VFPHPEKLLGYPPGVPLGGPPHPGSYIPLHHGFAIFLCIMALQLHRLIRSRLHEAQIFTSPARVLEKLALQRKALGVPTPHHQNLQDPMM